ncbi:MAG: hypothetical protein QOJ12_2003 [Thermoleophilales bacterium]|nr:hypothetical protein [Thermoleophilales bacterium]
MSRSSRPSPALVVAFIALFAAIGGIAIASPLGSDGRVHFCFNQLNVNDTASASGDEVVATNAGTACPSDKPDELVFNQSGPQGPQGTQGTAGGFKALDPVAVGQALGGIGKVDKQTDRYQQKLRDATADLRALEQRKGQVDPDALAAAQRRLIAVLLQVNKTMAMLNDNNRNVLDALVK